MLELEILVTLYADPYRSTDALIATGKVKKLNIDSIEVRFKFRIRFKFKV